jgi:hypothetical protein
LTIRFFTDFLDKELLPSLAVQRYYYPAFIRIHSVPGAAAGVRSRNEDLYFLIFPLRLTDLGALVKFGQYELFMAKQLLGGKAAVASAFQQFQKTVTGLIQG